MVPEGESDACPDVARGVDDPHGDAGALAVKEDVVLRDSELLALGNAACSSTDGVGNAETLAARERVANGTWRSTQTMLRTTWGT